MTGFLITLAEQLKIGEGIDLTQLFPEEHGNERYILLRKKDGIIIRPKKYHRIQR